MREFREDIEGLRALAVLPILVFHLNPQLLPGGFVGVDVFFVISGYLITGLLLRSEPGFSYRNFWYRRFRRLYPALLTVAFASLVAGYFLFSTGAYSDLAFSSIASLLGVSNIWFAHSIDYFTSDALLHPNLHTWSLGVEEQFYVIWPLILFCLVPAKRFALVFVVGGLSFLAGLALLQVWPMQVFYQMPFRIFEFALGAAVLWVQPYLGKKQSITYLTGLLGLGVLIGSWFVLDGTTPWPSLYALLVCSAVALVIASGGISKTTLVYRLLAFPVLRMIGRWSYSIYLVHWPLIVFTSTWYVLPVPASLQVTLFVGSLALGWLLFTFIEQVFRVDAHMPKFSQWFLGQLGRLWPDSLKRQSIALVVPPLLVIGVSCLIIILDGLPARQARDLVQRGGQLSFGGDVCSSKKNVCVLGDIESKTEVFVVGDSHAMNLFAGLDDLFKTSGVRLTAFYDHGCLFFFGTRGFTKTVQLDRRCERSVNLAYKHLLKSDKPVIFIGSYSGLEGRVGFTTDSSPEPLSKEEHDGWFEEQFQGSLKMICAVDPSRKIILFKSAFNTSVDIGKCRAAKGEVSELCRPGTLAESRAKYHKIDEVIERVGASLDNVTVIDQAAVFCPSGPCIVDYDGELLFRDTTHLTRAGSQYLARSLADQLKEALAAAVNSNDCCFNKTRRIYD